MGFALILIGIVVSMFGLGPDPAATAVSPPGPFVYECAPATNVTPTSATLNAFTTDPSITTVTFTLYPGGIVLVDNDGPPWMVNAVGLTPNSAYTYTVEFDPGDHPASNQLCHRRTPPLPR